MPWRSEAINPDDVVSMVWARLDSDDDGLKSMVNSITKGQKRPNGASNPSCVVYSLVEPTNGETDLSVLTINITAYADQTGAGRVDYYTLGRITQRVRYLMSGAHLKVHPAGRMTHGGLSIMSSQVINSVTGLAGEMDSENYATVQMHLAVRGERVET